MTDARTGNLNLILEKIARLRPRQNLLVITDTYARPIVLARDLTDLANSMGIEAVMTMMRAHTHYGEEPPRTVAAAMKAADVIIEVTEMYDIAHTNARKEATEAGIRYYNTTGITEDYLEKLITIEDLIKIKERTEKLAEIVTRANSVRITSPHGTDITMSLTGRVGIPLHALTDSGVAVIPDYAEVATAPVEGTTEGVIVVDAGVEGWGYLLRKPIRFEVKKGKVQLETIWSDIPENAKRLKQTLSADETACNCAAELGLQTSHTIPKPLQGGMWDFGMAGNIHIACGRNNDIGGETWSSIHQDCLLTDVTVRLDEMCVIENGEVKI